MTNKIDSLTEYLLNEDPKLTSVSTTTQQSKINRATGQIASNEAKKRNDPLYQKMQQYKELYYRYRMMIQQKYGARSKPKARR